MFTKSFEKKAGAIGSAIMSGAKKAGQWAVKPGNAGKLMMGTAAAGLAANAMQGKGVRQSLTSSPFAPKYQET
jgi:hypothetical protein